LSAGTPTERRNAGAFWHGFNVIEIDADGRVRVEMREGPPGGGAFVTKDSFDLAPLEEQDRRRHARDCQDIGIVCKRMLCVAEIDPYGDAHFVREFRGVTTRVHSVAELPGPYLAAAQSGLVEAFSVRQLSEHGPSVSLESLGNDSRECIKARIKFGGSGLQKDDSPIDFLTEFYANSAFALNRWQFECMYPERSDPREMLRFHVCADIAVQELLIHVRFPDDAPLPRRIDIKQRTGTGANEHWSVLEHAYMVRIESQSVVQARIPYPAPGSLFELNWELRENDYGDGNVSRQSDIARALHLRERFVQLIGKPIPAALTEQLGELEFHARDVLGDGPERAYDIALFAFCAKDRTLRYVAGSYKEGDDRLKGNYAFGLGIAGRAFKTGDSVAFRRPPFSPNERPWGYVMPDGSRVREVTKVKEAAILGVPLAPPGAPDWAYGVIQISTDDPSCPLRTTNTASDNAVEKYCAAVRALTPDFEAIVG